MYLPSELSVYKLFVMYDNLVTDPALKTIKSYSRMNFYTCFNLGFKTTKRERPHTTKPLHKLKTKAFYTLLKEAGENTLVLVFDIQNNQKLHRVADQEAYYSRQLHFHTFAVVQSTSKCRRAKADIFYCWTEEQNGKGYQIASTLYDMLMKTDMRNYIEVNSFVTRAGVKIKTGISS
ncbi:hypothetical protein PR048_013958, partial [Dryococelus australis]